MSYRMLVPILVVLLAAPAFAEEIVHFKNGTTMPIRSHNIEDGMVHVDMGADALMAFPVAQIDKIVVAGKNVFLPPSSQRANVGVGGGDVKVSTANPNNVYPAITTAPASSRRAGGSVSSPSSSPRKNAGSNADDWQVVGGPANDSGFATRERQAAPGSPNRSARQMITVGRKPRTVSADGAVPFGANPNQRRMVTSRDQLAKAGEYPVSSISPKSGLGTTPAQRGEAPASQPASGSSAQDSSGSDN